MKPIIKSIYPIWPSVLPSTAGDVFIIMQDCDAANEQRRRLEKQRFIKRDFIQYTGTLPWR